MGAFLFLESWDDRKHEAEAKRRRSDFLPSQDEEAVPEQGTTESPKRRRSGFLPSQDEGAVPE
ncbi:MAG: hypothetical protein IK081_00140 [Lachnospiraceae bacterium]|nr:hypothetical protein [Lachnospiraceae bacterium]